MVTSGIDDLRDGVTLSELCDVVLSGADPASFKLHPTSDLGHTPQQRLHRVLEAVQKHDTGILVPVSISSKRGGQPWADDEIFWLLECLRLLQGSRPVPRAQQRPPPSQGDGANARTDGHLSRLPLDAHDFPARPPRTDDRDALPGDGKSGVRSLRDRQEQCAGEEDAGAAARRARLVSDVMREKSRALAQPLASELLADMAVGSGSTPPRWIGRSRSPVPEAGDKQEHPTNRAPGCENGDELPMQPRSHLSWDVQPLEPSSEEVQAHAASVVKEKVSEGWQSLCVTARTHARTHARTYTHTRARAHTHTYTHTGEAERARAGERGSCRHPPRALGEIPAHVRRWRACGRRGGGGKGGAEGVAADRETGGGGGGARGSDSSFDARASGQAGASAQARALTPASRGDALFDAHARAAGCRGPLGGGRRSGLGQAHG